MSARSWHVERAGARLILSRRRPARFDLSAQMRVPLAGRLRLAHQVRQDVWRAMRGLRGFTPVVEVTRFADHMILRAGGQMGPAPVTPALQARLERVLACPQRQARWIRCAGGVAAAEWGTPEPAPAAEAAP
ncbi:hypothetical protein IV417_01335 [Alphaproteobacteria bacterium KMM 3653]|uniref:Uncharacterized protein n=1 Tax=Harenicola maris TaxID=2841044 RepID=A0AAP2CPC3_9RHOB|nr:hypothetical protein [Harenicola maris]